LESFVATERAASPAGRPVRIRMGKGPDGAKGGGIIAIEDFKVT